MKTLRKQKAERIITAMFEGLEDDPLKTVMEVMYGLKDEAVLDELRLINEQNLKDINERMTLGVIEGDLEGKVVMYDASGNILNLPLDVEKVIEEKTHDNVNADDTDGGASNQGHINTASKYTSG